MAIHPPIKPPDAPASKPENKFDPFRPDMPQIPGVDYSNKATSTPVADTEKPNFAMIGGILAGVLVVGLCFLWWIKGISRRSASASVADPASAADDSTVVPDAPVFTAPVHDGPIIAATTEELSKPWAAKKFNFFKPVTREAVEAIVIRLPGEGLWAFGLQEPYGRCKLEFVTDLSRLAKEFGYRATHPMVVNSCSSTIYDPLKLGAVGSDVWVRGEIVQGGGLRPPLSIDLQVSGHSIIARKME